MRFCVIVRIHTRAHTHTLSHVDAHTAGKHPSENTDNQFHSVSQSRQPIVRPQQLRQEVSHLPLAFVLYELAFESKILVFVESPVTFTCNNIVVVAPSRSLCGMWHVLSHPTATRALMPGGSGLWQSVVSRRA